MVLNYFVKMKIEYSGSVFYTFVSITDINRIYKIQQHKEFCTKKQHYCHKVQGDPHVGEET